MSIRQIPEKALVLIKQFEGLRFYAYPDPATNGDPWTIGYGHTGPEVKKGLKITAEQADKYLVGDVSRFVSCVEGHVIPILNDNQFSAVISLVYNIGAAAFLNSTLLKCLNKGDYSGAAKEFLKWDKAAGKKMPGLTRRRAAESKLFLS